MASRVSPILPIEGVPEQLLVAINTRFRAMAEAPAGETTTTTTIVAGGGGGGTGSQTPWASDIDGAGFALNNPGSINVGISGGNTVYISSTRVTWRKAVDHPRWDLVMAVDETGSNAGSNLYMQRFADDDTYLGHPLVFMRDTGYIGVNFVGAHDADIPAAPLHVQGSSAVSAIYCQNGFIDSDGGYYSEATNFDTFNAPNGGMYAKLGFSSDQAVYLSTHSASSSLNTPATGYGGLAYKGGGEYWYYNATLGGWSSIDFSAVAGGGTGIPGGVDQSVQHKNGANFRGDGFLKWDWPNQTLIVDGKIPTPPDTTPGVGIHVTHGYIDSELGFYTPNPSYQSIQSPTGGAILAGLGIVTASGKGGYIDIPPQTGTFPVPLTSASFASDHILIWSSNGNGTTTPVTSYTLCCNSGIRAAASFISGNTGVAAFQSDAGGATLGMGVYLKDHGTADMTGAPAGYGGIAHATGSAYWYWDGANWKSFDFATSVPAGVDQSVQYKVGSAFAGDDKLKWDFTNQTLRITAKAAAPLGLKVIGGYIDSDIGFATANTSYQSIKADSGGALIAGLGIVTAGGAGGYIDIPPQAAGVNYPVCLPPATFGTDHILIWSSATNATATPVTAYTLCTNAGFRAAASVISGGTGVAAFQSDSGGATLGMAVYLKGHATGNVAGGLNDAPATYGGLAYKSGSTYWFWDSSAWKTIDLAAAVAGGGDQSVQYRNAAGAFAGDDKLTWNYTNQVMTIIAKSPAPSVGLKVQTGYIDSDGGFNTGNASYQAIQAPSGGLLAAGLGITSTSSGTVGGYIDLPPLSVGYPAPLASASFGANDVLLWSSNSNATATPVTGYSLCTNAGIRAAAGIISANNTLGAFTAANGGATFGLGVQIHTNTSGSLGSLPASFGGISYQGGSTYLYWNGSAWSTVNFASIGGPGGGAGNVQFNNGTSFGGSANLNWNDGSRLLTVNGTSNGVAALAVTNGFIQSNGGLYVDVSTNYNSIQTVGGIVALQKISVYPAFTPDLGAGQTILGHFAGVNQSWGVAVDVYDTDGTHATITPAFVGRRALGPAGGPYSNLPNGIPLMTFGGRGSTTAGFVAATAAAIRFLTSESWTVSANGAEMAFAVTPNGSTSRADRVWIRNSGMLEVAGTSGAAGIQVNAGFVRADDQGFASTGSSVAILNAPNGGAHLGLAVYLKTNASSPPNPLANYGGLAWNSGSNYWYWNGTSWGTINLATGGGGVTNVNGFSGAISIAPGTGVSIANSANTVTVSIGQAVHTGASPTFAGLTSSGPIQCSGSGIVFQTTSPFNIQMDNTGVVSCQQLNIAGVKCVGSDRIWVQTVQTNNHCYAGDFGIIGGGVTSYGNHTGYTDSSGAIVTLTINGVSRNVRIIGGIICKDVEP